MTSCRGRTGTDAACHWPVATVPAPFTLRKESMVPRPTRGSEREEFRHALGVLVGLEAGEAVRHAEAPLRRA
ncbi:MULTISPECIES: hypothetical protein [Streptomyces]|uniref:Uncharacterized protein n=1 Tax=Streptomyces fimbriatus TaxID=68197 RepID=A0ABW0DLF3_STRFI